MGIELEVKRRARLGYEDLPVHKAASSGDIAGVVGAVDTLNVDLKSFFGFTPLCLAVMSGHEEVVSILLNLGADPDVWMGGIEDSLIGYVAIKKLRQHREFMTPEEVGKYKRIYAMLRVAKGK